MSYNYFISVMLVQASYFWTRYRLQSKLKNEPVYRDAENYISKINLDFKSNKINLKTYEIWPISQNKYISL